MSEAVVVKEEYVTIKKSELDNIKFKKNLLIISRIIAFCLVIAIAYFGWVNYQYGSMFEGKDACYRCGYENIRRCECVYQSELVTEKMDIETFRTELAAYNNKVCEPKEVINNSLHNINYSMFNDLIVSRNSS